MQTCDFIAQWEGFLITEKKKKNTLQKKTKKHRAPPTG